MALTLTRTTIGNVLTRATGYLTEVCSHSLQPYRGCSYGRSLCGAFCYVQHSPWVTKGRAWGSFLEVRTNAAESYLRHRDRERRWARRDRGRFSIFLSSATDPFVPQERAEGVSRSVLEAMLAAPPDELIVQTHSHRVTDLLDVLPALAARCELRVHVSIEGDRERLPGLPPPASPLGRRFEAVGACRAAGLFTVVTASPLFPLEDPEAFFHRVAGAADAVVLDHFVGGDGSPDGARTRRTPLAGALARIEPSAVEPVYRDEMAEIARKHLPGRVGLGPAGFAGSFA